VPPVCRCSSGWLSLVCIIKRRGVDLEGERERGEGKRKEKQERWEEGGEAKKRRRVLQRKGKREERKRDRGRERSVTGKKKGKKKLERARAWRYGARWRDKEGDGKCGTDVIKTYRKKKREMREKEEIRMIVYNLPISTAVGIRQGEFDVILNVIHTFHL